MENYLNDVTQCNLRQRGLLKENEVAKKIGDLVVAVSAIDNSQRIVGKAANVLNENKKVLKG